MSETPDGTPPDETVGETPPPAPSEQPTASEAPSFGQPPISDTSSFGQPPPAPPYGQPGYGQPSSVQPPSAQPGYGVPGSATAPPGYFPPGYVDPQAKSKIAAGLFGIFLGGFGIHRFYLGYTRLGIIQIIVSVVTCGIGSIWGFVEGILYLVGSSGFTTDADGRPLRE